mgnify:CR=1 FL=1
MPEKYDSRIYEKPSVTVDIAVCTIKDGELQVLLIERKHPPFRGSWAIPGGFVELPKNESLEETAARELREETGLKGIYLEQLKSYGDPGRDPRMRIITVAFFALVPFRGLPVKAGSDASKAEWFPIRKLPTNLAFDHKKILADVVKRMQEKIMITDIAFNLVPKKFIWSDLKQVYEVILNKKLIDGNFRRKIKGTFKIKELKETTKASFGRPSRYVELLSYS